MPSKNWSHWDYSHSCVLSWIRATTWSTLYNPPLNKLNTCLLFFSRIRLLTTMYYFSLLAFCYSIEPPTLEVHRYFSSISPTLEIFCGVLSMKWIQDPPPQTRMFLIQRDRSAYILTIKLFWILSHVFCYITNFEICHWCLVGQCVGWFSDCYNNLYMLIIPWSHLQIELALEKDICFNTPKRSCPLACARPMFYLPPSPIWTPGSIYNRLDELLLWVPCGCTS